MLEKNQFPTLQSLAIEVVACNYLRYPELQGIPQRIRESIIEKSIDYCNQTEKNVVITAPYITQQKYWKACCQRNKKLFNSLKLEDHGFSYKIAYIEKYVQKLIESIQNYHEQQRQQIINTIKVVSPWVFNLELRLSASQIDIDEICYYLYNIINLSIRCSEGKNTDYKKKIIGMKFSEARDLSQILRKSSNLLSVNLAGNLIDDDLFKFISPGLQLNTTLIDLNLSYNKLGDQSARRLAKFLIKNKILTHLNLSSNNIGYDGSRYIAQALKLNCTLDQLNIKLNSLDDKAGAKFFKDLSFNTNLKILNIQSNLVSVMTVRKLCLYLQVSNSLREIYLGGNNFTENDHQIILNALPNEKSKDHFQNSKFVQIKL